MNSRVQVAIGPWLIRRIQRPGGVGATTPRRCSGQAVREWASGIRHTADGMGVGFVLRGLLGLSSLLVLSFATFPAGAQTRSSDKTPKSADGTAPKSVACPIVPLRLTTVQPEPQPAGLLSVFASPDAMRLEANGNIILPMMVLLSASVDPKAPVLDPQGCMIGTDGSVWVDATDGSKLWTLRAEMPVTTCGIQVYKGRWLMIDDQGFVRVAKSEKGPPDPAEPPTLRFLDFKPEACCAARIMLAGFLSMMPSMAVSDGNPVALPPPKNSACPEKHKK